MFTEGAPMCTLVGCMSGFMLNVFPNVGWPHGAYRFRFGIDGRVVTCTASLPFVSCDAIDLACDGEGVHMTRSGCARPANQHSFAGSISFDGYPQSITIDTTLNGRTLAHARFQPRYQASQPNGAGCMPVCCSAGGDFTIALPPP